MQIVQSTPQERHVAVLSFPFASHPVLLLRLVRRLAAAAPTVKFSFFGTAKSNRSLFSDVPAPDNIGTYDVSDGIPEGYVFSGNMEEIIGLFLGVAPEEIKRGLVEAEEDTGRKITCLISDAFLWFSGEIAEEIQVPWVALRTGGSFSLSTHVYTDLIRQTVGLDGIVGREDEILKFIPGLSALRLGDLPSGILFGNLESPFAIMAHKMGQILPQAAVVAINCFEDLEPDVTKDLKVKFKQFLNVGPFNLTSPPPSSNVDEHGCIPWLNEQKAKSVAYIAFGTMATLPPNELVALAEALEATGTPFLWSLKDNLKKHLPEGFFNRTREIGKIVPWAPQVQVLTHTSIGVFATHCGWNSVLESIAAGVPIMSRPFFGDQQINTWMVENVWQIGVRVEGGIFTKSGTIHALEQILSHEKGKKLQEKIAVLQEVAFEAVGPTGSSTENFKTLLEVITGNNL